ncbi:ABC transporter permease [Lentilactobacillus hilgardii]|uniref:ABC transporter permease n=1 Tax=Lentilactobacillus hilgardii TaxID=1588 RepID=UPI0021C4C0CB|nr:ABC transporter permease subunit [Lentilactobacillus hilgardii]MCP9332928.1 ABC transporter permease subunit [Lentilactobacillus hilgardii]MCP9349537.1 ABC transporter permease subunit [Lentilactobacillus hilgardii]MCP9352405.1 ABC transporter permease subunit [Lentilactobacillus hilgardii]
MKKHKQTLIPKMIIALISIYLVAPIIATTLYSFSTSWVKTILPEGLTFHWYAQLIANPDFVSAMIRSLGLGILTTIIAMTCFLPIIFYANVYNPGLKARLRFITVLPFTIPGIILVTGLIQVYQNIAIPKIIILLLAVTLLSLPLTYQTLDNAFISRDFRAMFEQSLILGDKPVHAFIKVILPNIKVGIFVASLLTFTTAFGEYVITNMLLGGDFETLKIYMYRLMQSNGQASSVLTTIYFAILALISLVLVLIVQKGSSSKEKE